MSTIEGFLEAPYLSADSLHKRLGGTEVVRGVSLAVRPGEVVGFLGPNGAGKTTTLKMILGLVVPDSESRVSTGWPRSLPRSPFASSGRGGFGGQPQPLLAAFRSGKPGIFRRAQRVNSACSS